MLQTFQCGSQLLSMNFSNHWEDIWWSYPSKMYPKTYKICEKMKAWKCEYLLNHCTNFLVWFTTNFYVYFKSLRGSMMILSPKMHPKTYKICEKMKAWKCEYLLNHCTNFSVWFTTTFYECSKSLRGYMMIVSLQKYPKT